MRDNGWLAERRLVRVRDWLEAYRAKPALTIESELRRDYALQVLARIIPAG